MKTLRFRPDGSCALCSGGWLCKVCQADNAERERRQSATIAAAARGIRATRIARVCARFELESDEMATREQKAAAMLAINPSLA